MRLQKKYRMKKQWRLCRNWKMEVVQSLKAVRMILFL